MNIRDENAFILLFGRASCMSEERSGNRVKGRKKYELERHRCLTYYILVGSSIVIYWTCPFVVLGVSGLFCPIYSITDRKSC